MADYTLKCTGEQLDDAIEKANSAFMALDNKLNKNDVYDGLDSEDVSKALSARQGKLLKGWIDNCITYNKDTDLGEYSLTAKNFTFKKRLYASNKEDSSELNNPEIFLGCKGIDIDGVYARLSPFDLAFSTPNDYTGFYVDKIDRFGVKIYFPYDPNGNTPANAEVFALRSDIPSVDNKLSTTSINPIQNKVITDSINKIQEQANDGWKFLGKVGNKKFTRDLGEIKPGSSGTTTGANIYVDVNAYEKTIDGVVKYKTVLDVIVETNPFELKHLDLKALLSNIGSKWFFPRVIISRSDMNSSAFNNMIARLYEDREVVSMSFAEVSVSRDMSTSLGNLNASGGVLPIGGMNADGFNLFAVLMELDRDNANKNITTAGGHWKVVLFHPNPYNI